jgi:hypothetical protein
MRSLLVLVAVFIAGSPVGSHADSIFDGDFSSWSFANTDTAPGNTATVTREGTGGNPGARLNINTITGDTVYGTGIKTDYSTSVALSGQSFTLALDVLDGPGARGQGQGIQLLVEQNSTIYGEYLGVTFDPLVWTTRTFSGAFTEALFDKVSGPGAASPDFSGGVTTFFGFAGGNSRSGDITLYYDNFQLESAALTPVPEPSMGILVGITGLIGLGGTLWRRRRHS